MTVGSLKLDNDVLSLALPAFDALRRTTGVHARVIPADASGNDNHVVLESEDGMSIELPYKIRPTVDRRDKLLSFKALYPDVLLVTQSLSTAMAEECRALNIPFVDQAGNCYIKT